MKKKTDRNVGADGTSAVPDVSSHATSSSAGAVIEPLLARIDATERRQIADQAKNDANQVRNEERFKLILDAMQDKRFPPQKVFYDGQIYDAFEQMKKFVRMARTELIVIDRPSASCVVRGCVTMRTRFPRRRNHVSPWMPRRWNSGAAKSWFSKSSRIRSSQ